MSQRASFFNSFALQIYDNLCYVSYLHEPRISSNCRNQAPNCRNLWGDCGMNPFDHSLLVLQAHGLKGLERSRKIPVIFPRTFVDRTYLDPWFWKAQYLHTVHHGTQNATKLVAINHFQPWQLRLGHVKFGANFFLSNCFCGTLLGMCFIEGVLIKRWKYPDVFSEHILRSFVQPPGSRQGI